MNSTMQRHPLLGEWNKISRRGAHQWTQWSSSQPIKSRELQVLMGIVVIPMPWNNNSTYLCVRHTKLFLQKRVSRLWCHSSKSLASLTKTNFHMRLPLLSVSFTRGNRGGRTSLSAFMAKELQACALSNFTRIHTCKKSWSLQQVLNSLMLAW